MKLIFALIIAVSSNLCFSSTIAWNDLRLQTNYTLNQDIILTLDEKEFIIPIKTKLTLVEDSILHMIKVRLQKFKLLKCPSHNLSTDLELVTVLQSNNSEKSVGANLAKNCILEVYIELEDQFTNSFFK